MFYKYIIALVSFLLLTVQPIYSAPLAVDIYGTYDFVGKTLSIFWKTTTAYTSFKIEVFAVTPMFSTDCFDNSVLTLKQTNIETNQTTKFTNVPQGRYRTIVYGVKDNVTNQILTKDFYIVVVSPSINISWCTSGTAPTGTTVYSTSTPSFDFGSPLPIDTWKALNYDKYSSYFTQDNLMFVNIYNTEVSPPSAQIIIYSVLPSKPTWDGIR